MHKPSLSVAVPAHNEEKTIASLLSLILLQVSDSYHLSAITVYDDASTDATANFVRDIAHRHPIINLVSDGQRRGKLGRLNQIFSTVATDYLIVLDGDISLEGNQVFAELLQPLIHDATVMLVSGHQVPLRAPTFAGKVLHAAFALWDHVRSQIPNRDHVENFYGAVAAYRGRFAKTLHIPDGVGDERLYLYLMAKQAGSFAYRTAAVIYYWPVTTFKDYIALGRRSYGKDNSVLDRLFGSAARDSLVINPIYKIRGLFKAVVSDPIYTPLAIGMSLALAVNRRLGRVHTGQWTIAQSSKKSIAL